MSQFPQTTALHACAYLLHRHGGTMPVAQLSLLVFWADRRSCVAYGHPMLDLTAEVTRSGPRLVELSAILTQGGRMSGPVAIELSGRQARLVSPVSDFDPLHGCVEFDMLSVADCTLLDAVYTQGAHLRRWRLRRMVLRAHPECAQRGIITLTATLVAHGVPLASATEIDAEHTSLLEALASFDR